jgi:hypothetical protein
MAIQKTFFRRRRQQNLFAQPWKLFLAAQAAFGGKSTFSHSPRTIIKDTGRLGKSKFQMSAMPLDFAAQNPGAWRSKK